jgi:uncharacterized protein YceK
MMTGCISVILSKFPREGWETAAREMAATEDDENCWGEPSGNIDGGNEKSAREPDFPVDRQPRRL